MTVVPCGMPPEHTSEDAHIELVKQQALNRKPRIIPE